MKFEFLALYIGIIGFTQSCLLDRERYCTCDEEFLSVTCSRLGDAVDVILPHLIPDATRLLVLQKVWVDDAVELAPHNFYRLQNLEYVNFSHNRISVIHAGTFSDMKYLQSVDLSHNRLKILDEHMFMGDLYNLEEINLSHNRLLLLLAYNFKAVKNLKFLDLRNNPILFISPDAFSGLSVLEELNISTANLTKFPAESLGALSGIRRLDFRGLPYIKDLPPYSFSLNRRLEYLIIEKFEKLSRLGPHDMTFAGLENLHHLVIASCNLTAVPSASFFPLAGLRTLDLSRNLIRFIYPGDFNMLPKLERLILHNTGLQEIKSKSFVNNKYVQVIDLSNNSLDNLYRDVFPHDISHFKRIIMSNNPWSCDCELRWILESKLNFSDGFGAGACSYPRSVMGMSLISLPSPLPGTFYNCSPPSFIKSIPSNITVKVGEKAKLECGISGVPPLKVTWISPSGYIFRAQIDAAPKPTRNIVIAKVRRQDAGRYICVARNAGGIKIRKVMLKVVAKRHGSNANASDFIRSGSFLVDDIDTTVQRPVDYSDYYDDTSQKIFLNSILKVPEKSSTETTVIIAVLGCSAVVGAIVVFAFIVHVCKKRYRHRGMTVDPKLRESLERNGRRRCQLNSGNIRGYSPNMAQKSRRKTDDKASSNQGVVLGGQGIYSRPITYDPCQIQERKKGGESLRSQR